MNMIKLAVDLKGADRPQDYAHHPRKHHLRSRCQGSGHNPRLLRTGGDLDVGSRGHRSLRYLRAYRGKTLEI